MMSTDVAVHTGEAIHLDDVAQSYATANGRLTVLEGVTLEIGAGEVVSLIGPSGCGKSTLLKIIAGLVPHDSGVVRVGDQPAREGRRDIGFMLQQPTLMPWLSVRENVALPFRIARRRGRGVDARVDELLELVGLSHAVELSTWELSGGMQQRVALARALALDPSVMLMDEPFSALDEFKREHLNIEVAQMSRRMGKTTILVTHSIHEAVLMSDRIITLGAHPGRVIGDIPVGLPPERHSGLVSTEEFQRISADVRETLNSAFAEGSQ